MTFKGPDQLAGFDIPEFEGVVSTAAGKCPAIEAEGDRPNRIRMSRERVAHLSSVKIPDLNGFVGSATD